MTVSLFSSTRLFAPWGKKLSVQTTFPPHWWWLRRQSTFRERVESILTICGLRICKLTCLLTFICTPQINTRGAFVVIHRHVQRSEKFVPMLTFPAEGDGGDTRLSFRSPTVNKAFSCGRLAPSRPRFCAFCWWFHCLKWTPSIVLKCSLVSRGCGVPYRENPCLQSSVVQPWVSAVGCGFVVNESAIFIK